MVSVKRECRTFYSPALDFNQIEILSMKDCPDFNPVNILTTLLHSIFFATRPPDFIIGEPCGGACIPGPAIGAAIEAAGFFTAVDFFIGLLIAFFAI